MMINRYYEEKYQELQQRYIARVDEYRREIDEMRLKINETMREQEATHEDITQLKATINDIKCAIKQFAEKTIIVDVHPFIIKKNLIYMEEWTSNQLEISTLSLPFETINCSDKSWSAMAIAIIDFY